MADTPTYQTNAVDELALQTPQTPTRSLSSTIGDLNTSLTTAFAPIQQTIMQAYQGARSQTQQATEDINKATTDRYQQDINFQNQVNTNQGISQLEGQRGFAINPGAIAVFQQQADKRVKDLHNQMNDALLNNNAIGAKALADLMVNEQTAITNARTTFLNQYFSTAQEARAQKSFQSPEQQSVMTLANSYPDAGILPSDDLATATAKVQKAPSFAQNIALGQANINKAIADVQMTQGNISLIPAQRTLLGAQAGLAGSQAQLTSSEVGLVRNLTGGTTRGTLSPQQETDVQALLNGTMTPQQLQNKYSNVSYNGISAGPMIANNILAAAQAQGYNVNKGTLEGISQEAMTKGLAGGSIWNLMGIGLSQVGQSVAKALTGTPQTTTPSLTNQKNPWTGKTSSGLQYTIQ